MATITTLTDAQDPRLDDFRDLNSSTARPDRADGKALVIAEGNLVGGRALTSRCPVRAIIGIPGKLEAFLSLDNHSQIVEENTIAVYSVSRELLADVAGFDVHRGLLVSCDRPEPLTPVEVIDTARTVVVCEGVGDHENIGSIFRNAAGFGVDGILFGAGCADPYYRRSIRVSMGHALHLPFAHFSSKYTTWQHDLDLLKERGFRLVSLTPDPQQPLLSEALYQEDGTPYEKIALLIGAEGPGLTEHAMRATDIRARIPMAPGTDSLNVATALAVALYERSGRVE